MDFAFPLSRQLGNAIEVVQRALELADEKTWTYGSPPFYQIAFHAIYALDMYFSTFNPENKTLPDDYPLPEEFTPFAALGFFDKELDSFENPQDTLTKDRMLKYLKDSRTRIREYFSNNITDQFDQPSGFPWLPCTKFELIVHNIRHLMGHSGVLNEYLKVNGLEITGWIGGATL